MKIECILQRKGGTLVEMPGKNYHFQPQEDGRHVAEVTSEAHIERFLSIREAYRLLRTPGADAAEEITNAGAGIGDHSPSTLSAGETLLGSSQFAATFTIHGTPYTLGDIVSRAFLDSGLTAIDWNGLDDEHRATKIEIVLDALEDGEITLAQNAPQESNDALNERAALDAQYKERFGKLPPSNMKLENLKTKLAEGTE